MNIIGLLADVTVHTPKKNWIDEFFAWVSSHGKLVGTLVAVVLVTAFFVAIWRALPKWVLVAGVILVAVITGLIQLRGAK